MSIVDPEARMVMLVAEFNKMLCNLGIYSFNIRNINEALRLTQLFSKFLADIERNDRLGKEFLAFVDLLQIKFVQIKAADACMSPLKGKYNNNLGTKEP